MVVSIRGYVWSKEIFREVFTEVVDEIVYPATWWDAVKERWYPKFLKRIFPPKYICKDKVIHKTVRHIHTCPHINVATRGSCLHFLSAKSCHKTVDEK